jgi:hypothetical protein
MLGVTTYKAVHTLHTQYWSEISGHTTFYPLYPELIKLIKDQPTN